MRRHSFWFTIALLFLAVGDLRAENTFSVTSAVTPLNFGGKTEVLGGITLTSTAAGTSVSDALEFLFPQLEITNGFTGQVALDPGTGMASAPGGITLSGTGGWRNAGVHLSFQASSQGGKVYVALPAGALIGANDSLSLNGIRADISTRSTGEYIRARISSLNSTYNITEPAVGWVKPALNLVVETGYVPG